LTLKVLGIEVLSLEDLVRLHVDLKKDRLGLFSYKEDDKYYIGFYFPPVVKEVNAVFTYAVMEKKPPKILSYSYSEGESEHLEFEYIESSRYFNIPVAYIDKRPHNFIDPSNITVSYDVVNVEDVYSLAVIAFSTHIESALIPFIWHDYSRKIFTLNVEASSDDEYALIFFSVKSGVNGNYIEVNFKESSIDYVNVPRDISKKYLLIVHAKDLPFYKFKRKED